MKAAGRQSLGGTAMMIPREITLKELVLERGFAVIDCLVSDGVVEALLSGVENELGGDRAGTRQLHQRVPALADFLQSQEVAALLHEVMPGGVSGAVDFVRQNA